MALSSSMSLCWMQSRPARALLKIAVIGVYLWLSDKSWFYWVYSTEATVWEWFGDDATW